MLCSLPSMARIGPKSPSSQVTGELSIHQALFVVWTNGEFPCRAQLCREKAIAWKTRNPTNPAHLQLRLESLKRMKQAYEVYNEVGC